MAFNESNMVQTVYLSGRPLVISVCFRVEVVRYQDTFNQLFVDLWVMFIED